MMLNFTVFMYIFLVLFYYCKIMSAFSEYLIPNFEWIPADIGQTNELAPNVNITFLASNSLAEIPVYISITTINARIKFVVDTIRSIFEGDILPTHLYLLISRSSFLKDLGIQQLPEDLKSLAKKYPLSVVYTRNIGPHRMLLPILSKYWLVDCVIVTIDDDVIYPKNTLSELIGNYIATNQSTVVARRVRRIGICPTTNNFFNISSYDHWHMVGTGIQEMLLLPTGRSGVLYKPQFFHPIVFDQKLRMITQTNDDLTFRLATLINKVYVKTACNNEKNDDIFSCPSNLTIIAPKVPQNFDAMALLGKSYVSLRRRLTDATNTTSEAYLPEETALYLMNRVDNKNGNMWHNAIKYISSRLELNLADILATYLVSDRRECLAKHPENAGICGIFSHHHQCTGSLNPFD